MKLIVTTQDYEWYGRGDTPAEGEGRWKPKGGTEYEVADLAPADALNHQLVASLVRTANRIIVSHNSGGFTSSVIGHEIIDGPHTRGERQQIEDSGEVYGPRQTLARLIALRTAKRIVDDRVSFGQVRDQNKLAHEIARAMMDYTPDLLVMHKQGEAIKAQLTASYIASITGPE